MISTEKPGTPEELVHYGVKGMKWGVRKDRTASSGGGSRTESQVKSGLKKAINFADDVQFELASNSDFVVSKIIEQAGKNLREKDLPGIKAKHSASGGSSRKTRFLRPTSPEAKAYRADVKSAYLKRLEEAANARTNIRGTRRYTITDRGKPATKTYRWELSTEEVKHSSLDSFSVHPVFDAEGYIIRVDMVDDSAEHAAELGESFVAHILGED